MTIEIGTIVTDISDESSFNGKQARISRIVGPDEFYLEFHKRDMWLTPGERNESPEWIEIEESYTRDELQVDSDWKPETYAERLFRRSHHSISKLKYSLNQKMLCVVEECEHTQTTAIWVNIWGTVCDAYVCDEHKGFHGKCMEIFPWRKKMEDSLAIPETSIEA